MQRHGGQFWLWPRLNTKVLLILATVYLLGITYYIIKARRPSQAYVLFMSNDFFIADVMALEQSFREVGTAYQRVVLVTEHVSPPARATMASMDMQLIDIKQKTHNAFKPRFAAWNTTLSKLEIFQLTQFDTIVYIDADFILLDNIDELFSMRRGEEVLAMGNNVDCTYTHEDANAGLLVLSPSLIDLNGMMQMFETKRHLSWSEGDQQMIQYYFHPKKRLKILQEEYASFVWRCSCEQEDIRQGAIHTKAIHFTHWGLDPDKLLAEGLEARGSKAECALPIYQRWLDLYHKMEAHLAAKR